ncbi:MAG: ABC transporter permease [Ekhidna sp.]
MFKNYFNIALRNLLKHKFYTGLNIVGLAIGLACFMLISLFILDELSYDRFHDGADRIYRVDFNATLNGSDHISAQVGAPLAAAAKSDFPQVEDALKVRRSGTWFLKREESIETFKEETVLMADSNFFQFFTIPLKYGSAAGALQRPNTIALDATTATKIFGDINPVGERLILDGQDSYEVTAVYEDLPQNSHFTHNVILSMVTFDWTNNQNWLSTNFNTYLKLKEGSTMEEVQAQFPQMIKTYCEPLIEQFLNMNLEELFESGNSLGFGLTPLTDIHLYSHKDGELEANGDIKYVYIFSAVALFILILACINFMNLSTARSANRAKEVGVRKVMGAYKNQLINQFLSEAILISFISTLVAFLFTALALPLFNSIASKSLSFYSLMDGSFLLFILALVLVVGILAGSYPAFYLSMFRPAEVLKGTIKQGVKSGPIRSTLVVFQFAISIIMIIGTAIVFDQLSFIQNKKLGFDKDQVLMVHDAWILRDNVNSFKEEASRNSNVINSTIASFTPTGRRDNSDLYFKNATASSDESLVINIAVVDYTFINTLGLNMVEGRGFSEGFSSDSTAVIINETAARRFGYDNPVGSKIYNYGGSNDEPVVEGYRIIGVVEDFHFQSLRENISPLVMHLGQNNGYALFKIQPENIEETIAYIEQKWEEIVPGQPFQYSFMDQEFNAMYAEEQKVSEVFTSFSVLAIVIACLGLFGLAAFTAEQKTKEIGIRKTLGATVTNIVTLLSKNFMKLVLIAFGIAIPVSYWAMNAWLEDFAYRTTFKPTTFIISGLIALLIALLTIGFQSWNAARVNPAESLKDE